jgi:transposase
VCVVGKVFKPSRLKVSALNMALNEGFRLVEWYLSLPMEDLNGIRSKFKRSKKINRRFHSSPFRRLQTKIEYRAYNIPSSPIKGSFET